MNDCLNPRKALFVLHEHPGDACFDFIYFASGSSTLAAVSLVAAILLHRSMLPMLVCRVDTGARYVSAAVAAQS